MKLKNSRGITLIALIVTIIVLVVIAGVSIAALTSDNGILRQTNAAKVEQMEGTAREQVKLAISAMRLAVAEASSKDNSYKANQNAGLIQAKLVEILNQDKSGLNGIFGFGGNDLDDTAAGTEITISYTGDDYQNACNDKNADIIYTITLGQKSIELTDETNTTLKDENQNDTTIDVGGNTESGSGNGSGNGSGSGETPEEPETPVTPPATTKKLVEVASIGDIVNYDPTTGGNVDSTNTTYTSVAGSTTAPGNGSGSQTFSASNYKNAGGKWRILNIEGETITLISDLIYRDSETTMGTGGLQLSGGIGYLWAEEELHRIASIYGHGDGADLTQTVTYYYGGPNDQDSTATGEYALSGVEAQQGRKTTLSLDTPSGARALTVEDVNKICGQDSTYTASYSSSTVTKNSNNAKYYPTLNGTSSTGQSSAVSSPSGSYYYTYYTYEISSANTNQNTMLKPGTTYWLASRCVSTTSSNAYFIVRLLGSSFTIPGDSDVYHCVGGVASTRYRWYPMRSVITLKSGIQTGDTEYDSTTGWNLVK